MSETSESGLGVLMKNRCLFKGVCVRWGAAQKCFDQFMHS